MTVAVLIVAVSASLLTASWRKMATLETVVLAILSAIGLKAIDFVYVSRHVIAPVYLIDGGIEILILVAWVSWRGAVPRLG